MCKAAGLELRNPHDLQSLELKISEAKTKKDMYIARARSAEASLRLQEMLGEVGDTSSLKAFEKMEDKLLKNIFIFLSLLSKNDYSR